VLIEQQKCGVNSKYDNIWTMKKQKDLLSVGQFLAEYTPPANHGDHCAELSTYTKKTDTIN